MFKLKDLLSKKIIKKIDEASGTGSALGGRKTPVRKPGYTSPTTKTRKSTADTAKTTTSTKKSTADSAKSALTALKGKNFRMPNKAKKGTYFYSSTPARGYKANPDYTAAQSAYDSAHGDYTTAQGHQVSTQSDYGTSQAQDTAATFGDTPPAVSGTTGGMKGRAKGGKGKGKKKKV